MNADAAQQCLDISRCAWSERRDLGKALKFARKAEQLHSTAAGRRWLAELSSAGVDGAAGADGATRGQSRSAANRTGFDAKPEPAKKESQAGGDGGSSNSSIGREYTGEQVEAVRRIKKCGRDYYAVLGLVRDCSDADIKKAYRKVPPRSFAFYRRWLILLKIYC